MDMNTARSLVPGTSKVLIASTARTRPMIGGVEDPIPQPSDVGRVGTFKRFDCADGQHTWDVLVLVMDDGQHLFAVNEDCEEVLNAEAAMAEIDRLMKKLFKAKLPPNVRLDVLAALVADEATAGRLPTRPEIAAMMGSDEDEDKEDQERDPRLNNLFPRSYEELEALWQLRGYR